MLPIDGFNDVWEIPSIVEAEGYFFLAIRCGGTNQDLRRVLFDAGLTYFRDEDAYGVESNPEGVCKRFVTVTSS